MGQQCATLCRNEIDIDIVFFSPYNEMYPEDTDPRVDTEVKL